MKPKSKRMHSLQKLQKLLMTILESNCQSYPWYKKVLGYTRNSDWARLYDWTELPLAVHGGAAEHFAVAQITALVKKFPFNSLEIGRKDPRSVALEKFRASEEKCRKSNLRLSTDRVWRSRFADTIVRMREDILRLLGDEPSLVDIYPLCGFGSGANLGVHGNATNLYRKLYAKEWTVTPGALPYAVAALCSNEQILYRFCDTRNGVACITGDARLEMLRKCKLVRSNKVSFVPKTALTHRSIAVEPLLNTYIQKGVDSYLRRFLFKWGIDLRSQEKNQELARFGSVTNSLSTMDLSAASDSISINLVKLLLPPAWYDLLNSLRSPEMRIDGTESRYHKFTSMGNGFCFPLETIIFAACVRQFTRKTSEYAVYGDDIVVPKVHFDSLRRLLSFLGFETNVAKSFKDGPFRESCGSDWYDGQDVRPVYLDYLLDDVSSRMIFHNSTLRSERCAVFFQEARAQIRAYDIDPLVRIERPTRKPLLMSADLMDQRNSNGAYEVPLDLFMGSRHASWNPGEQRWNWKEFLFLPESDFADNPSFHDAWYLACLQSPGTELNRRYTSQRTIIVR